MSKKKLKNYELDQIIVLGAREHNLKNIHVEIPKKNLVVITGVSGSGKSSLAFDTLFAEGQRRYVESLSSYARQFLGQMERPKYDTIRGLSPTIAIEQKAASKNPRSTVGTITEVYDYLRILFSRIGTQFCPKCHKVVGRGNAEGMVDQILSFPQQTQILILAPLVENRKGEHRDVLDNLRKEGHRRIRIDGVIHLLEDVQALAKNKKHNIEVVVDRVIIKNTAVFKKRLTDSVELALKIGHGDLIIHILDREDIRLSESRSCCGMSFPELIPQLFSFNSPLGMCQECHGIGTTLSVNEEKVVVDKNLTLREGAIHPWISAFQKGEDSGSWTMERILAMNDQWGLPLDTPWKKIPKSLRSKVLYGGEDAALDVAWESDTGSGEWTLNFEGLIPSLLRRYKKAKMESRKTYLGQYMSTLPCIECQGTRLKSAIQHIRINKSSIIDVCSLTIGDAYKFFCSYSPKGNKKLIASEILKEIQSRLSFLVNVGLDYLSLDRHGPTLSGGEAQRIRLASQIGSELTGVLYILDEPSIGLHQKDNQKLIDTLCRLRDIGNTVLVVEHDQETMEKSDWIIDIGPGAGHLGGQIVAEGTPTQIKKNKLSMTGKYLKGALKIETPDERRVAPPRKSWPTILGATENNLKNIDVSFPPGLITCVTGVSGAGKSTLINQILFPALSNVLLKNTLPVGKHKSIKNLDGIDKVINIDQKPIGRTPRSNPATYTKLFDLVRDTFALLPEARARGYSKGRFSFNVKGGRCEHCQGDGHLLIEMHFLADVLVPCEVCNGKRFNQSTLEVTFKGHNISDILDLSVREAMDLFQNHPRILKILKTLFDVGLTYIKLGQAATTLSGGEAQRIKLARELAKKDTGSTLYILDEPTTGLHFQDVDNLLNVIHKLCDAGNTIIIIEHNLDVIKTADWVIDMGPLGGSQGGEILAQGTPEKVAAVKKSYTGNYLKNLLG